MDLIFLPLTPGTKMPRDKGWAAGTFEGVDPAAHDGHVGVRTDNLVVVDCDTVELADAWRKDGHPTPLEVKTGRGSHFYYQRPPGTKLRSGTILPGLDVKTGPGSYVLAPGATHPSGSKYDGLALTPELLASLPVAPEARLASLAQRRRAETASSGEGWDFIPEGQRNVTLTSMAGTLRKQGAGAKAIAKTILGINRSFCRPPLDDDEVVRIALSAAGYEPDPDTDGDVMLADENATLPRMRAEDFPEEPPAQWLWRPYVIEGEFMLVDSREGWGKTLFAIWVAAQVAGGRLPIDPAKRAAVLYIPAEDKPGKLARKLKAAGYRPGEDEAVYIAPGMVFDTTDAGIEALEEVIESDGVRLVIIDPVRSFLKEDGIEPNFNNEAFVRPGMTRLSQLAQRTGATIIGIHHQKKGSSDAIDSATGSAAFTQVVRHRVALSSVGVGEARLNAMIVQKSNEGSTGHLREYFVDVVGEEEDELVVFRPGDPLDEPDLETWRDKAQRKMREEEVIMEDVTEDEYGTPLSLTDRISAALPMGQPVTVAFLKDRLELTEVQARATLRSLREHPDFVSAGAGSPIYRRFGQ